MQRNGLFQSSNNTSSVSTQQNTLEEFESSYKVYIYILLNKLFYNFVYILKYLIKDYAYWRFWCWENLFIS